MADGSQHTALSAVDMLRKERLRQKLDLADIAKETCIRSQFLEAIEKGDTSALPGNTFVMGFVRSYARALNMDENAVVDAYRAEQIERTDVTVTDLATPEALPVKSAATIKAAAGAAALEQPRRGVPKWLAPFLGLVGAVLSWSWFNADGPSAGLSEQQQIAEVTRLAAIQAEYALDGNLNSGSNARSAAALVDTTEEDWQSFSGIVEARLAETSQTNATRADETNLGSILMPSANAGTDIALSGTVTLVAEEDTWIQLLHADGTEAWSGLLEAGDEYRTELSGTLFLTTSNAGGLFLNIGGEQVGPLGERGAIISGVSLDQEILERPAFHTS